MRKGLVLVTLALLWEGYARWLGNPLLFPTLTTTIAEWKTQLAIFAVVTTENAAAQLLNAAGQQPKRYRQARGWRQAERSTVALQHLDKLQPLRPAR